MKLFLGLFSLLIASCATKAWVEIHRFSDLEKKFTAASGNWTYRSGFGEKGTYRTICSPMKDSSIPMELRGQCYYEFCQRAGNKKNCEKMGQNVLAFHEKMVEAKEAEKEKNLLAERAEAKKKCHAGDMTVCQEWIQRENSDEYDVLGKLCQEKKFFSCKTTYEEPNVEKFQIKCEKVNDKTLKCEEIYDEKFATTILKYLR